MKKCDAFCDSRGRNLWLRNGKFYYIIELPRVDGKRRYLRMSLKTDNYYEAIEKMKIIKRRTSIIDPMTGKPDFKFVHDRLKEFHDTVACPSSQLKTSIEIARLGMEQTEELKSLSEKYEYLKHIPFQELNAGQKKLLKKLDLVLGKVNAAPAQERKISEMFDSMLLRSKGCGEEKKRKRSFMIKLLGEIGLTMDSDYSKFHNVEMIDVITKNIKSKTDVKGDVRRKYVQYVKELMTHASNRYPDDYKQNVIVNLPIIEKTKKSDRDSHLPYTESQLIEMFDPKHPFFKKNEDVFFSCLIAMFTGARRNSATTLQYNDIIVKDGVDCIHFQENHELKRLKNEASERIVPINSQLLGLGFMDYIQRKKKELKASGTDFIFPKCITSGGQYNNKFMRSFFIFLEKIGIRSADGGRLDFHSFRKNASIKMQDAGIPASYINDIIGWEGKTTMEQSYSNHTLSQIKAQVDKFGYDFLQTHFDEWKKIMAKK
jgi:integrase